MRCMRRRCGRKSKGETWWWNEEVKEAVSRKKDVHRAMCTEENKRRCKSMKNKAKKAV